MNKEFYEAPSAELILVRFEESILSPQISSSPEEEDGDY